MIQKWAFCGYIASLIDDLNDCNFCCSGRNDAIDEGMVHGSSAQIMARVCQLHAIWVLTDRI